MNLSTAIFLINPNVRCVAVSYDKTIDRNGKDVPSQITSYKTFDTAIKVGDLAVIPTDTRWGQTVGRVTAVDLDVDHDSPQLMRWITQRLDTTLSDDIAKQEAEAMARVKAADTAARQRELAAKLMEHSPDFNGLSLIDMKPVASKTTYAPEPEKRGGAQA